MIKRIEKINIKKKIFIFAWRFLLGQVVTFAANRSIAFKAEWSSSLTSCWFSTNRLNSIFVLISNNNVREFIFVFININWKFELHTIFFFTIFK